MTIIDWILIAIGMYLAIIGLAAKHAPYAEELEPRHRGGQARLDYQTITTRETAP
jgi:hypothetical protein